jgi:hypothetical protein
MSLLAESELGDAHTKMAASATISAGIRGLSSVSGTRDPNTSVLMTDDKALSPITLDSLAAWSFVSIVVKNAAKEAYRDSLEVRSALKNMSHTCMTLSAGE